MEHQSGFQPEAFKMLAEAEAKSFWFNARNNLIIYTLKKYFPHMKKYIEIGCGTGFVLNGVSAAFSDCEIYGSELFEEGLVYARKRVPAAKLIQRNAVNMTDKEDYDVFGAFDVLEHIQQDEAVMRNLHTAIRMNGGGGVLTVPQHMFMWSVADDSACHVRRYSQKELRCKLTAAGFRIEWMTGFVSLLFPFMLFSRLRNKKKKAGEGSELRLPRALDAIFAFIMKIEFLLLRLGIHFPFGGSIITVVKK